MTKTTQEEKDAIARLSAASQEQRDEAAEAIEALRLVLESAGAAAASGVLELAGERLPWAYDAEDGMRWARDGKTEEDFSHLDPLSRMKKD